MTNKEAIQVLKFTSVNLGRRCGRKAYAEALEIAITALDQLDNNSTKPDNSTATQFNGIESKVKGFTACRVPEDDCISRQAAIDELETHRALYCNHTPESFSRLSYADKSRVDEIDGAIAVLVNLPSAQPELIEKAAYIRGFEQGRTQGMIDSQGWKK